MAKESIEKIKRRSKTYHGFVPSSSKDDMYIRQQDIVPIKELRANGIGIIGAGAVGRQVCVQLATMGGHLFLLWDDDTVEEHNIPIQGYSLVDRGEEKVRVLQRGLLREGKEVLAFTSKFEESTPVPTHQRLKVVFCCVDNMQARGEIWRVIQEIYPKVQLFIDGRVASEVIRVLVVPMKDEAGKRYYESQLFTDAEGYEGACTDRMTFYSANVAAGLMVCQYTKWLRRKRGVVVALDTVVDMYGGWLGQEEVVLMKGIKIERITRPLGVAV